MEVSVLVAWAAAANHAAAGREVTNVYRQNAEKL